MSKADAVTTPEERERVKKHTEAYIKMVTDNGHPPPTEEQRQKLYDGFMMCLKKHGTLPVLVSSNGKRHDK